MNTISDFIYSYWGIITWVFVAHFSWRKMLSVSLKASRINWVNFSGMRMYSQLANYVEKWRNSIWSKASQPMFRGKTSFTKFSKLENFLVMKLPQKELYTCIDRLIVAFHCLCLNLNSSYIMVSIFFFFWFMYVQIHLMSSNIVLMSSLPQFLSLWIKKKADIAYASQSRTWESIILWKYP